MGKYIGIGLRYGKRCRRLGDAYGCLFVSCSYSISCDFVYSFLGLSLRAFTLPTNFCLCMESPVDSLFLSVYTFFPLFLAWVGFLCFYLADYFLLVLGMDRLFFRYLLII